MSNITKTQGDGDQKPLASSCGRRQHNGNYLYDK